MAILDDSAIRGSMGGIEVVRPVGRRRISHVMHDVDGTHSLIREWPPVMSVVLHWAMTCGLGEEFDSAENLAWLAGRVGKEPLAETDRFCVESAGLSALTQMEYAIRRAVELGRVPPGAGIDLSGKVRQRNAVICRLIWGGQERFDSSDEQPELTAFIRERTPRLFRFYEHLLNRFCRDRNVEAARRDPAAWRVPGSPEFLRHLRAIGCKSYFVTGAVLYADGGMWEEIRVLGYEVGPGRLIEAAVGSAWDRKVPKDELMAQIVRDAGADPGEVLIVGDGRSEISAGVAMGGVTISRLGADAARQRQLHRELGTNYILADYADPALKTLIHAE